MQKISPSDLLKNPDTFKTIDFNSIHEWVKEYPYSALFRVLALKKKFDNNAADRTELLEAYTPQIPDREVLHQVVRQNWDDLFPLKNRNTETSLQADTSKTETQPLTPKKEKKAVLPGKTSVSKKVVKKKPAVDGTVIDTKEKISKKNVVLKETVKPEVISKKSEISKTDETVTKQVLQNQDKPLAKKEKIESRDFSGWLQFLENKTSTTEKPEKSAPKSTPPKGGINMDKPLPGLDDLEKFDLKHDSKKKPQDSDKPDVKELANRSVTSSDDLITETYVRILTAQKKYDKAIEAYQKLSLKIPGKSSYFAGLIKELEKNI